MSLLTKLGYDQPYSLSVLSHDNALSLFCQHALGERNFDSYPALKPHGEGIVGKCDGLPLALIALGRLLRTKIDDEEWKEVLNSEIWELGKSDEIGPALRLSYHDLPALLKLLFAYCSLFPKDYVFEKEELILLWMAEGFLQQSSTGKSMERLGIEYFEELSLRSFFQKAPIDKSLFVMHDLMNDLATSVAGEFFSRLDIEMKNNDRKDKALEKYRHMSFVCEDFITFQRFSAIKGAKNLRTFLAVSSFEVKYSWQSFYISNKVLLDLLRELSLLRVLSLSKLSINEVPEFIGSLKHLRYLNLSKTDITCLPDNICNLSNLQTLIVSDCNCLETLPNNFPKLKNLRHFDIGDTPRLKKMPLGIGELKSLQTLSKIIIEGENGFSINDLKDLKDLQGKISIKGLEKVQSPMQAQEANISQKRLDEFEVAWSDVIDASREETIEKEVLNVLNPSNDHLKKLKIVSYGGREFPNWVGNPSFLQLRQVSIIGCKKCTSLPPLGQLPSLKELIIEGIDEVKVVGLEFLGTSGEAFPSLETLRFEGMKGWEGWSTNDSGIVNTTFPCLKELVIGGCANLVRVSLETLPVLRVLRISKCSHEVLTSLVSVASLVMNLNIRSISGLNDQVWGGVVQHLGAVEEVCLNQCNEIRYLLKSEAKASKVFLNLRKLEVRECSNFVRLGEKEEDCGSNLTSLRSLYVNGCNSMEVFSCPDNIEDLSIDDCDSITSVCLPIGGEQKLKSLRIGGCDKLLENEFVGGKEKTKALVSSSILMLESLEIINWRNLKSITELSSYKHLRDLIIHGCLNMESFPDHELPKLSALTKLIITNCESMDASFSHGLWPPRLSYLEIGRLKNPISEWGPQNFPTSLVNLRLQGGPSEDVSNFSQLSHLLPSSLTSFRIHNFEKVESVSVGLQHLTSLQKLLIQDCPKVRDLPEKLLPSLLSLTIFGCPKLKGKIIKGGSYWPLVSRIPLLQS